MSKFKREFSAGGIVVRQTEDGQNQVLLIHNIAMRDPNKKYWGFPKGHINPKESSKDAAIREVKEETGLVVEVIKKIGDSKYVFTSNSGEKVFKVVIMFLMKPKGGKLKFQKEELLGVDWLTPSEALEKLSFQNDKKLLKDALKIMANGLSH